MRTALSIALALAAGNVVAQSDSQLRYACKQFVEGQLHDPGSADLDWTKGVVYKPDKAGNHVVRFRGRAKNAMGALTLGTFECRIRYTAPDHFQPVSVRAVN